jgi:hypothetical protein
MLLAKLAKGTRPDGNDALWELGVIDICQPFVLCLFGNNNQFPNRVSWSTGFPIAVER